MVGVILVNGLIFFDTIEIKNISKASGAVLTLNYQLINHPIRNGFDPLCFTNKSVLFQAVPILFTWTLKDNYIAKQVQLCLTPMVLI